MAVLGERHPREDETVTVQAMNGFCLAPNRDVAKGDVFDVPYVKFLELRAIGHVAECVDAETVETGDPNTTTRDPRPARRRR